MAISMDRMKVLVMVITKGSLMVMLKVTETVIQTDLMKVMRMEN